MSFFDKFKLKKYETVNVSAPGNLKRNKIYAPASGETIPLEKISDGVFSEGILGQGCGIMPNDVTVYAPFDGKVVQIAETGQLGSGVN
ncbi:MAG: PTS glucose transporter subunit IIA [Clostridiales bacterium]|nr:PTS glucose transporter subunit IIA [Clostridiales bacterium]